MKSVLKVFIIALTAIMLCISVSATEVSFVVETEVEESGAVETESEATSFEISTAENVTEAMLETDQEFHVIIGEVEEGKLSLTEAVILIAEKAGISVQDAEYLLEKALAAGDAVLGEKDGWTSFKASIEENKEFWIVVVLLIITLITILFGAVTFILKVKKPLDKIEIGTIGVKKDSENIKNENSQTLANLSEQVMKALKEDELIKAELVAKNEKISELELKNEELRRGMLDAEMYTLQMLELIYSRTNLPLADKAVLDLWKAQAESSLKSKMTSEDIAKHEEMKQLLRGKKNEKKV